MNGNRNRLILTQESGKYSEKMKQLQEITELQVLVPEKGPPGETPCVLVTPDLDHVVGWLETGCFIRELLADST